MSISVSRESISKLMTELVDTFPMESEGRSSISDFGKLLFTEGQSGGAHAANATAAPSMHASGTSAPASNGSTGNSTSNAPASDDDERDDDEDDEDDEDDDVDDEDDEQSAIEDAKIAGAPAVTAPGQKRVFTEIKGVPRQKQPDVQCVVAENGKISLSQTSMRKIMKSKDKAVPKRWTQDEDDRLREAVGRHGERNWKSIAEEVPGRNHTQCLQRWTKVLAPGLVKGHWRPDEDELLKELVAEGRKNWGQVATRIPGRTSKQCRERWYNHLDPSIVRGEYTAEEDRIILEAQSRLGNRWSAIAAMLPGRTEDAVKIRWKSLCRVRKGQGRRTAQGGNGSGDKPRASTPKAGGAMMPPPHHMLHHHAHLHPHHVQHHGGGGGGSFSGGPMVKSEELGAFSTAAMRAQQQQVAAAQQQHMNRLQYSNALQQQQMAMTGAGGGYHMLVSPSGAHSMMYAGDMSGGAAAIYDPSTGQYRKTTAAVSMGMHSGYGQDYNLDRRASTVTLTTPTHQQQQQQSYRTAGGGGGYAATSPYAGLTTDMNGNVYAANGAAGGYVMASSMSPMYHARPELVSSHVSQQQQQQQMMIMANTAYGYSAPPPTPSNGVASAFAQGLMHQHATAYQQSPPQQANQENESAAQEPPSPQQQQQKESAQASGVDGASNAARGDATKSPAKTAGATAAGAIPASFNPAAMFAQSQQSSAASKQPAAMNPVAAFLQQQQQKPKVAPSAATLASGSARPPFNPAAAFAQRFQGGKPPMPVAGKNAATADDADDDDAESSERVGNEPSLKKVKPRLSIDAARASAARRMRNSGNSAAALAGRGSLDVFLNEIGDVGRLSDLKMDEFQTLDELWRVSDDMNRLSL